MTVLDDAHGAPRTDPGPPRRRFALTPVTALAALVVLAALVALFLGGRWALTATDDGLELAAEREVVLTEARQAAINFNSLDHRDVAGGLDRWEQSSTGTLLEEFRTNRAEYEQVVTQAQRVTEAKVQDAAVSELDGVSGRARVLLAMDVEIHAAGQEPLTSRQRLLLEMTRTDQGWKASRVAPVRNPS